MALFVAYKLRKLKALAVHSIGFYLSSNWHSFVGVTHHARCDCGKQKFSATTKMHKLK